MTLSIKNTNSNYLAKVVRLQNVRPHPNADRLQLATVDFNTIIVGKDAQEGQVYIYFPLESALNPKFLSDTNSYSDPVRNVNPEVKGFFNKQGRVRAVKLRGTPSEGYVVPLQTFNVWASVAIEGYSNITEEQVGTEFDTIEDFLICEKYIPQHIRERGLSNKPKGKQEKRFNRIIDGQFHFHVDTAHLKKNIHRVNPDDTITISYKLHGTSMVASRVLVKRKLKLREKLAKLLKIRVQDSEYGLVYSSRKVIKNEFERKETGTGDWYKEDVWGSAAKSIQEKLEDGVSIYAEIVGYTPSGSSIQKGYDYGCKPGQFKVYVYRMTYTNQSGRVFEFSTNQIKNYCERHGLEMVPILFHGQARQYVDYCEDEHIGPDESLRAWREELLDEFINDYLEQPCHMCNNNVPAEGVVVTVEREEFQAFKLKSFSFLERETKELDNGEIGLEA